MKTSIQFYTDSATGGDCLLHFSSSGSKEGILESLKNIISQIESDYGKPHQHCVANHNAITHVITPLWNGEKY